MVGGARKGLVALVAGALMLMAAGVAPAAAGTLWFAELSGDTESPGPGDPDGFGFADIDLIPSSDPTGAEVCVELFVDDIGPATAAHIHEGAAGVAGPIVITLPLPGAADPCVTGLDSALVSAIIANPGNYYVNVHTEAYPAGAIRGQIEALQTLDVILFKYLCPEDYTPETEDPGEGSPATHSDDFPCANGYVTGDQELPEGYEWDIAPVGYDLDFELEDEFGSLFIGDADPYDFTYCDTEDKICYSAIGYIWRDVIAGDLTVTEITQPPGYRFRTAIAYGDEEFVPLTIDGSSGSVSFDSDGNSEIFIEVFNAPDGDNGGGGGGGGPTLPPTTAAVTAGDGADTRSGSILMVGLVLVAVAGVLVAAAGGVRRRGSASR